MFELREEEKQTEKGEKERKKDASKIMPGDGDY